MRYLLDFNAFPSVTVVSKGDDARVDLRRKTMKKELRITSFVNGIVGHRERYFVLDEFSKTLDKVDFNKENLSSTITSKIGVYELKFTKLIKTTLAEQWQVAFVRDTKLVASAIIEF